MDIDEPPHREPRYTVFIHYDGDALPFVVNVTMSTGNNAFAGAQLDVDERAVDAITFLWALRDMHTELECNVPDVEDGAIAQAVQFHLATRDEAQACGGGGDDSEPIVVDRPLHVLLTPSEMEQVDAAQGDVRHMAHMVRVANYLMYWRMKHVYAAAIAWQCMINKTAAQARAALGEPEDETPTPEARAAMRRRAARRMPHQFIQSESQ